MKKALYSLKQAQRTRYNSIDSYFIENGFHRSESEPTLYTKVNEQGNMLIFWLYVDDLIFTSDFCIKELRRVIESEFEMNDLGPINCFWDLKSNNLKFVFSYHSQSM